VVRSKWGSGKHSRSRWLVGSETRSRRHPSIRTIKKKMVVGDGGTRLKQKRSKGTYMSATETCKENIRTLQLCSRDGVKCHKAKSFCVFFVPITLCRCWRQQRSRRKKSSEKKTWCILFELLQEKQAVWIVRSKTHLFYFSKVIFVENNSQVSVTLGLRCCALILV